MTLLALLTAAWSCVEPAVVEPAATSALPLSLSAVTSPRTKGYVEGTALAETPAGRLHDGLPAEERTPRSILLTAWLYPQSGGEQEYFRGQVFSLDGGGAADGLWHRDPKVYWPVAGTLDFLALSSGTSLAESQVRWDRTRSTDAVTVTVGRDFTQDDLLFSCALARTHGPAGVVPMTFSHSQAWLQFVVRARSAAVADVVTLHRIYLEDIYTSGELTVSHPFGVAEGAWDFRWDRREDTAVDDVRHVCGKTVPLLPRYLDMLLPEQPMKSIVVEYSLQGGGMVMEYEYPLPVAHWEMGKKYIYEVVFDPHGIEILPSVLDWDDVVVDTADNEVRGTGTAVNRIGADFDFSARSHIFWRADDTEDYMELTGGAGTWGDSIEFPCGDYVVTLRRTGPGTYAFSCRRDYEHEYFTVEALEDGTVSLLPDGTAASYRNISYSLNGGEWRALAFPSGEGTTLSVSAGDRVRYKGNLNNNDLVYTFGSSGAINVYGNIMSLQKGDDFYGTDVNASPGRDFRYLFKSCSHLVSAKNLILPPSVSRACYMGCFSRCTALREAPAVIPAASVGDYGCQNMFSSCTALVAAPALPATMLSMGCYSGMFSYCTSLTEAPDLPATMLAASCYYYMFSSCTSLTAAPALPATTLAASCYFGMFDGCTALVTPPALPATTLANRCYLSMFYNCRALTTAPDLPATTLTDDCYQSMFQGCTSLTAAPDLPAETLPQYSYYQMFYGCSSLNSVTIHALSLGYNSTGSWLYGVSASGTLTKPASLSLSSSSNGIPAGWTVVDL